ncbi:MAG: Methionine--tRNA ligase [Microgenomates bacterium OLB23]|nr:MAG: Methionine--tRNA ligase [Microgenomates bacterium OLB23]
MKKAEISYDVFAQLDVRVGQIMSVQPVAGSKKLLELVVNLGEDYGEVTVLSGIAQWYTAEQLTGKKTLFLANLAPRPMMGKVSHGMLVALTNEENEAKLIDIDQDLAVGMNIC